MLEYEEGKKMNAKWHENARCYELEKVPICMCTMDIIMHYARKHGNARCYYEFRNSANAKGLAHMNAW